METKSTSVAFEAAKNDEGKIVCFLDGTVLEPKPEEFVRQAYLKTLHYEYQYPKDCLAREVPIYHGSGLLKDTSGSPVRADIVIYDNPKACKERNQGQIFLIVECKAPSKDDGYNQMVSYVFNTSASGAVWTNGDAAYFRRVDAPTSQLISWSGLPRHKQAWDSLGTLNKSALKRPKDIKGLLRRCHNRLHGRGNDGDESDLTMDMVRLILAKAKDEEKPGDTPLFHCTPEEYLSEQGQEHVANRVHQLFSEVVAGNPEVFQAGERISVGKRAICDIVTELQEYRLLSNLHESLDWDLMGHAYEQYTATYLKRQQGQFFTNRIVTDFMVSLLDPDYEDVILDPAGGSGGFLTATMRYIRQKILTRPGTEVSKQRQLDQHRTRLFMVEVNKRLVKVAKTAMILNGDGHAGMTHGDSLGRYEKLHQVVRARADRGMPTVILTNPPFAGVGEGRITDKRVLDNFSCGVKWTERDGKYQRSDEVIDEGVPPEMLFFERCLDWVAPGGVIGIVMPKAFLDTQTYQTARHLLLQNFRLLAVVNCHKNTFQPHTGVRTCLIFIERPATPNELPEDYQIFMAVSQRIGQDSEGMPVFKRDDQNKVSDTLDEDLTEILKDYRAFKAGSLVASEHRFAINRSDIGKQGCINPQFYLPNLNKTIREVESIDTLPGWSTVSLSEVWVDVQIYKGPRLKSEDIIVELAGEGVEKYLTPSAVLQEKNDSSKLLDLNRASKKQLSTIRALRVQRGDLLVTRSGTIGRVAYVTQRLHDAIVSDDMIRIRIANESVRFYVYAFLQSEAGYNQMLKNEYGSVQQHLEPRHLRSVLIPIPDDWSDLQPVIASVREAVEARERLEMANQAADQSVSSSIAALVARAAEFHEANAA